MNVTHYIGFDVHKKTVRLCVKAADGALSKKARCGRYVASPLFSQRFGELAPKRVAATSLPLYSLSMIHDQWSLVGTFLFPDEAKLAQALLESAGIPTFLENEHLIGANWGLANALGGLRLLVPSDRETEASDLLVAGVSDDDLNAQAEAEPSPEGKEPER